MLVLLKILEALLKCTFQYGHQARSSIPALSQHQQNAFLSLISSLLGIRKGRREPNQVNKGSSVMITVGTNLATTRFSPKTSESIDHFSNSLEHFRSIFTAKFNTDSVIHLCQKYKM